MTPEGVAVRPVAAGDAASLAGLLRANREFLAPWDAVRPEEWFTVEGQRREIGQQLAGLEQDRVWPAVVTLHGRVVGQMFLNSIVRGAFQSADLGYWVDRAHNGRGVASAAVAATLTVAFGELGLHRVQAGTLLHNGASQRVLVRNGFGVIGTAPRYLRIAGRWQDHRLFQRLADDPPA